MLYYIILYYIILYYIILYYIILYYIILYYVILYYIILYYIILYFVMLRYIIYIFLINPFPCSRGIHLNATSTVTGLLMKMNLNCRQPGRKQARKPVRDARDFNNIETRAVFKFFDSCKAKRRRKFAPF